MKLFRCITVLALGAVALLMPLEARADGSSNFTFSGTLSNSYNGSNSVTGTFTMDTTTGQITAFNFVTPLTDITSANFSVIEGNFVGSTPGEDFTLLEFTAGPDGTDSMVLWFQDATGSFNGGALWTGALPPGLFANGQPPIDAFGGSELYCYYGLMTKNCNGSGASSFAGGSAVDPPSSPMPEPSSLALLAGGLFALGAFATRKRLA
jgi:hypothetical protein